MHRDDAARITDGELVFASWALEEGARRGRPILPTRLVDVPGDPRPGPVVAAALVADLLAALDARAANGRGLSRRVRGTGIDVLAHGAPWLRIECPPMSFVVHDAGAVPGAEPLRRTFSLPDVLALVDAGAPSAPETTPHDGAPSPTPPSVTDRITAALLGGTTAGLAAAGVEPMVAALTAPGGEDWRSRATRALLAWHAAGGRDGGTATAAALAGATGGTSPTSSKGDAVLVRAIPLGLLSSWTPDDAAAAAGVAAGLTHGHPTAAASAGALAAMLRALLADSTLPVAAQVARDIVERSATGEGWHETIGALDAAVAGASGDASRGLGEGRTAESALAHALAHALPVTSADGIPVALDAARRAVGDAPVIAGVATALLGARFGARALPRDLATVAALDAATRTTERIAAVEGLTT